MGQKTILRGRSLRRFENPEEQVEDLSLNVTENTKILVFCYIVKQGIA